MNTRISFDRMGENDYAAVTPYDILHLVAVPTPPPEPVFLEDEEERMAWVPLMCGCGILTASILALTRLFW